MRARSATSAKTSPDAYWRELDREHAYPERFVQALTEAGWLAALIPTSTAASGLGIAEAAIILEEVNRSGGNAAAATPRCTSWARCCEHGSDEQKRRYLPAIAAGELRLQAFGVTEPDAGSRDDAHRDLRARGRRPLRDQRPEGVHLARRRTPT